MTDLTWRKAIERVLSDAGGAMHYTDIAEQIVADGLRKNVGATPPATVNANISTSISKDGEKSPFRKVGRGVYMLKGEEPKKPQKTKASAVPMAEEPEGESEEQYDVVSSFGMFWRRDFIVWNGNPKILGIQQIGSEPVDFCRQLGIYLLYDGREVVYVGRSVERPLGRRLYEHTLDRLATRWNRFSWFGVLPVSDKGDLQPQPATYGGAKIIPALEAILIEALEPRQNRKRGDDLSAVEYLQQEDPEVEKRKAQQVLDKLASNFK
ncbi:MULTISPECIES: HTH domain-containing protein [unclassified Thioalkalivibrio]|uniref:HTH domain-containing protein n=1 Tax=unclassified Thioalkalivibrio TaxID=2621013 RepID=UPI000378114A|nr:MULTISPECIES: HTH domain-containing protein [unclassified Thioalkalivibrio]